MPQIDPLRIYAPPELGPEVYSLSSNQRFALLNVVSPNSPVPAFKSELFIAAGNEASEDSLHIGSRVDINEQTVAVTGLFSAFNAALKAEDLGLFTLEINPKWAQQGIQFSGDQLSRGLIVPELGGSRWIISSAMNSFRKSGHIGNIEDINKFMSDHANVLQKLLSTAYAQEKYANDPPMTIDLPFRIGAINQVKIIEAVKNTEETYDDNHFNDFVGIDSQLDQIRSFIETATMTNQEKASQNFGQTPKVLLLHGPSGVGKTPLLQAVANAMKAEVIPIDFSVSSRFVSEWAKQINNKFEEAYACGTTRFLIVIDEADGIINSSNEDLTRTINTVFKTQFEKLDKYDHVFVGMATNHVDAIAPELRVPKRTQQVGIGLPAKEARGLILNKHIFNNVDVDTFLYLSGIDVSEIIDETDGYSPSDLYQIVNKARIKLYLEAKRSKTEMRALTLADLMESFNNIRTQK